MSIGTKLGNVVRKAVGKPGPRLLTVKKAWHITPNMIRVTFAGPELADFPEGREGGNCKLLLPEVDETKDAFATRLHNGLSLIKRTYTVRHFRKDTLELDIDFVAHGDNGPASRWASNARPGAFLGFAGPSMPKVTSYDADWYLVAADPSALPIAAATLEAMPRDAKGIAVFEITAPEDTQDIEAPEGIEMHWLLHTNPAVASSQQVDFFRRMAWPEGRVQTCIAGESSVIKQLRAFLHQDKQIPRADTYISGYWKIGLIEDEHQIAKRTEG